MKPHIYKVAGIWRCRFLKLPNTVGLGYTPLQAYQEWLALRGAGV